MENIPLSHLERYSENTAASPRNFSVLHPSSLAPWKIHSPKRRASPHLSAKRKRSTELFSTRVVGPDGYSDFAVELRARDFLFFQHNISNVHGNLGVPRQGINKANNAIWHRQHIFTETFTPMDVYLFIFNEDVDYFFS